MPKTLSGITLWLTVGILLALGAIAFVGRVIRLSLVGQ